MEQEWWRNPWIWGGAAIAVIALWWLSSGSSSSSGTASYAQANLDLVAQQAQLNSNIEQSQIAANSTDTANLVSALSNLVNAKYNYQLGAAQVSAGVQQNQIQADTAKYIENDQVKMTRIQANAALHGVYNNNATSVQLAGVQAATATHIADQQAAVANNAQTLGFVGNLLSGLGL
jgi:hypothetical protein